MALSVDDSRLVASAPEIPGLAWVLDEERLAEFLRTLMPHMPVENLRAEYVRYKPGTSCLVGYTARHRDHPHYLYATAVGHGHSLKGPVPQPAENAGASPQMAFMPELGVGVRTWSADRKIVATSRFGCAAGRERLWSRLLPGVSADSISLKILRYKPERRLVARIQTQDRAYVLKAYTAHDFAGIVPKVKQIAAHAPIATARVVARSHRYAIQLSEWLPGAPLHQGVAGHESMPLDLPHILPDPATSDAIVHTLARLHRTPAGSTERALTADQDQPGACEQLDAACRAITVLAPESAQELTRIYAQVLPILSQPARQATLIHNDCSGDQFLRLPDGTLALVDWDELAVGDPMTDLAAFGADLFLRATFNGACQAQPIWAWISRLLDTYASVAPNLFCTAHFYAHLAARLMRLAPEPFRSRRTHWRADLNTLVELASVAAALAQHTTARKSQFGETRP